MFPPRAILPAGPKNAEEVKLGPIPLPLLITLCIFTPCLIAFVIFIVYRVTIKQRVWKKKVQNKVLREHGTAQHKASEDVDMQVRMFCEQGPRTRT